MDLEYLLTKLNCITKVEDSDYGLVDRFKLAQLGYLLLIARQDGGKCNHVDFESRMFIHDTLHVVQLGEICQECMSLAMHDKLVRVKLSKMYKSSSVPNMKSIERPPVIPFGSGYRRSNVWKNRV
ncbi:Orf78 [Heliothis zea nudivirus]|uniref:Uncharacterized protein n=2 Tax=Betanudivirus hezeae TaxID=3052000 RepID=G9I086_HZNV2|nr:Orf78 [Heliothis zea nudivirus]YP_004956808.1 orf60 gene product [Helicoverpa zea nudivirus 2]AAN04372.1 Orf78 [Heliothis zea nudivirus]AEW69609.1 hypothetical protein Hz2V060 [Helicoverpa zea nudivirus 2]WCZ68539.1 hypothetical protein HvNV060 [Heliothis virescens nudivirus]